MSSHDNSTLSALQNNAITLEGEFVWGSNYTYLSKVENPEGTFLAVYKPTRGQRPLWDFPAESLARREVAAYLVSEALGWKFVPPTVYRREAPMGPGSLQLFIEHDPEYHYFEFTPDDHQRTRIVALFDILVNNADRKGSHIIFDPDDKMWLIDHGLCFHVETKLRTVIWDFAGEPIPAERLSDLDALRRKLDPDSKSKILLSLREQINLEEVNALAERAEHLINEGCFPHPDPRRRCHPWPPL